MPLEGPAFYPKLFTERIFLRARSQMDFFFFWYLVTFLEKFTFTFQMAPWTTVQMKVSLFGSGGRC